MAVFTTLFATSRDCRDKDVDNLASSLAIRYAIQVNHTITRRNQPTSIGQIWYAINMQPIKC
jgi:hypothetical protein